MVPVAMRQAARQTAEERRTTVLAAAVEEFAIGGLAGTSTEAIARRAGISQPYVFRLWPSKKALFLDVVDVSFTRVRDVFTRAAEGVTGQAALDAMAMAYRDLLTDRVWLLNQMQAYAACGDDEVRERTRRGYRRLWQAVEALSGADSASLTQFFAAGMLLNVVAAMELDDLAEGWALACSGCEPTPAPAGRTP